MAEPEALETLYRALEADPRNQKASNFLGDLQAP